MGAGQDLLRLLRPHQWYKNALVLAPWVFSGNLLDRHAAAAAWAGFALFCVLSSGVYAANDAYDAPADRAHPTKRARPVAAGRIPRGAALAAGVVLATAALLLGAWLSRGFAAAEAAYLALQVLYITALRHRFLLDLASICGGFFLRSLAGVVLVAVALSPWLFLCTLFLALFLGLGKRQRERRLLGDGAVAHRPTLASYTEAFLAQAITITAASLLVSYSLYTFFHTRPLMMATIPFVLYGLFRYLHLMERGHGGEPEAAFRDLPSALNLLAWALAVVAILYAPASAEDVLRGWLAGR